MSSFNISKRKEKKVSVSQLSSQNLLKMLSEVPDKKKHGIIKELQRRNVEIPAS